MRRPYLNLFGVTMPMAVVVYWWVRDWWAHVGEGSDRINKFELPVWWQVGESTLAGSMLSGIVVAMVFGLVCLWSRVFRH
jgi:hypothetical protein